MPAISRKRLFLYGMPVLFALVGVCLLLLAARERPVSSWPSGGQAFSQDGQRLAYRLSDGHDRVSLVVADLDGGHRRVVDSARLGQGGVVDLTDTVVWTRDGRLVYLLSGRIWINDLHGQRRALARGTTPLLSPDGKQLAYLAALGSGFQIRLLPLAGGHSRLLQRLAAKPPLDLPQYAFAPHGRTLYLLAPASARGPWSVWAVDVQSGSKRLFEKSVGPAFDLAGVLPSGEVIVAGEGRRCDRLHPTRCLRALRAVDGRGGERQLFPHGAARLAPQLAVSPDGQTAAGFNSNQLLVLAGGRETAHTRDRLPALNTLAVSADGLEIAFLRGVLPELPQLWVVNVTTHSERRVE